MNFIVKGSHEFTVNKNLVNKLLDNTYRNMGSNSGREYRRAIERAQKKQVKKLALLPDYLK